MISFGPAKFLAVRLTSGPGRFASAAPLAGRRLRATLIAAGGRGALDQFGKPPRHQAVASLSLGRQVTFHFGQPLLEHLNLADAGLVAQVDLPGHDLTQLAFHRRGGLRPTGLSRLAQPGGDLLGLTQQPKILDSESVHFRLALPQAGEFDDLGPVLRDESAEALDVHVGQASPLLVGERAQVGQHRDNALALFARQIAQQWTILRRAASERRFIRTTGRILLATGDAAGRSVLPAAGRCILRT